MFVSGASIARGSPRTIGQKPEPTIRRGTVHKSLPEGAFRKPLPTKNTTKENFLGGVRVFSAKVAEAMGGVLFTLRTIRESPLQSAAASHRPTVWGDV